MFAFFCKLAQGSAYGEKANRAEFLLNLLVNLAFQFFNVTFSIYF